MVPSIKTAKKYGRTLVHRFSFTKEAKVLVALDFCTKHPRFEDRQLLLTTEQASLLALTVLSKLVPLLLKKGKIMLTPLAGAVFATDEIEKIAVETKQDKASVLISVIQSCQSGGEYLEMSQASIALVASVCATKYIRNEGLRNKIISRTYKQYAAVGKQIDEETFWIYARNSFEYLIRIIDDGQRIRYFGKNSDKAEVEPKESTSADTAAHDAKENPSVADATNKATRKIIITGQFESDVASLTSAAEILNL
ncbi:uncharacterized protein ACN2A1_000251 isoform 1-T3 [Glossina fuscipes fuscipes]